MTTMHRIWRHLGALCVAAVVCCGSGRALAQSSVPTPPPASPRAPEAPSREAERDALKEQIRQYSAMVQAMRESLAVRDRSGDRAGDIEDTVIQLSEAVSSITDQLADLELDVGDNQVSLRDSRGGQVTLELPENLSEQLSAGISSITRMFLEEMPDTLRIGETQTGFTWDVGRNGLQIIPVQPRLERRVIEGGIIKIRDDMDVAADEDVLGDAVAVLGDVMVAGRIRGDLVVVLGDVHLAETAEIEGQVISILGRLEREPGAKVASVTVINPGRASAPEDLLDLSRGWGSFLIFQVLFVGLVLLVLLLLAVVPRARVNALVDTAERRLGPCLGVGLLAVLAGHAVVIGLAVILVLTVIGIPVALLALVGLLLLDLAGIGVGAMLVGRMICRRFGLECPRPWRELLLGMILLHTPSFLASFFAVVGAPALIVVPLAWLGGLLKLLAFSAGLGALLLSRFGGQRTPLVAPSVSLDPLPKSSAS